MKSPSFIMGGGRMPLGTMVLVLGDPRGRELGPIGGRNQVGWGLGLGCLIGDQEPIGRRGEKPGGAIRGTLGELDHPKGQFLPG